MFKGSLLSLCYEIKHDPLKCPMKEFQSQNLQKYEHQVTVATCQTFCVQKTHCMKLKMATTNTGDQFKPPSKKLIEFTMVARVCKLKPLRGRTCEDQERCIVTCMTWGCSGQGGLHSLLRTSRLVAGTCAPSDVKKVMLKYTKSIGESRLKDIKWRSWKVTFASDRGYDLH